jgi:hypothetical protein
VLNSLRYAFEERFDLPTEETCIIGLCPPLRSCSGRQARQKCREFIKGVDAPKSALQLQSSTQARLDEYVVSIEITN